MSLAEQIRAIERRFGHENASIIAKHDRFEVIPTGWPEVDAALGGGLASGALHEWFGVDDSAPPPPKEAPRRRAGETASAPWGRFPGQAPQNTFRETWSPPVCLFVHLARQALEAGRSPFWIVWVGARCFPYPAVLTRPGDNDLGLLARSLFVAPRDVNTRLWAIDLALRSPAVGVVIADGSALSMAATRRVQLLAKRHRTLMLAARPPWEQQQLSAAQSRWLILRQPYVADDESFSVHPRWIVQLLRCKGGQRQTSCDTWALEWQSGTSTVYLSPEVAHPAHPATQEVAAERRKPRPAARSA